MKRVQESLRKLRIQKSSDPHLSIARGLNTKNLEKAKNLFNLIDVHFLCDSMVLRKFDKNIIQFFIIDEFKFNNNPQPEYIQGTLF